MIGPLLVVIPGLVAARTPDMDAFVASLLENGALVWITGGLLLFGGFVIIIYHHHWSTPSAVFISLLGWALALRGAMLLAVPQLIAHDDAGTIVVFPVARLGYGLFFLAGIWLIFVGWAHEPAPRVKDR